MARLASLPRSIPKDPVAREAPNTNLDIFLVKVVSFKKQNAVFSLPLESKAQYSSCPARSHAGHGKICRIHSAAFSLKRISPFVFKQRAGVFPSRQPSSGKHRFCSLQRLLSIYAMMQPTTPAYTLIHDHHPHSMPFLTSSLRSSHSVLPVHEQTVLSLSQTPALLAMTPTTVLSSFSSDLAVSSCLVNTIA